MMSVLLTRHALSLSHLDIFVSRSAEADPVLLVDIRGLEISESLPGKLAVGLLVEPDLDVILVDFITEQQDLLPPGNWTGSLCEPADGEVTLGFWR